MCISSEILFTMNPNTYFGGLYNKPFKIFVTASGNDEKGEAKSSGNRNEINVGPDSKAVYEEVISSVPASRPKTVVSEKPKKVPEKLLPFNKTHFLKLCQENDIQTLSQMDLTIPSNLNIVDDFGWSGLMIAACSNAIDAFSFLLSKDIDYEITDRSGRSALDFAEKKGHSQILATFRDYVQERRQDGIDKSQEESLEQLKNSFHCPTCDMSFSETTQEAHSTSVLHQFNTSQSSSSSSNYKLNYGIPVRNPGYQLMLKQGWNTRGLGPSESGRLYPVKTVLRKHRSGLGTDQRDPERVTHFQANDREAVRYRPPERVKGRREMSQDYESNKRKERRLRKALS